MSEAAVNGLEAESMGHLGTIFRYAKRDPPCDSLPDGHITFWLTGRREKDNKRA